MKSLLGFSSRTMSTRGIMLVMTLGPRLTSWLKIKLTKKPLSVTRCMQRPMLLRDEQSFSVYLLTILALKPSQILDVKINYLTTVALKKQNQIGSKEVKSSVYLLTMILSFRFITKKIIRNAFAQVIPKVHKVQMLIVHKSPNLKGAIGLIKAIFLKKR